VVSRLGNVYVGNGGLLYEPGSDGYLDGVTIIQGARTYDSAMQQWTTPDIYPGMIHDPMSQKPYMWNRNNPIAYSDPTGFYVFDNGSHFQQDAFDAWASMLDADVELTIDKIQSGRLDVSKQPGGKQGTLHRLQALRHDLQKGSGGWHVRFGPVSNGQAFTTLYVFQNRASIAGVGASKFDTKQLLAMPNEQDLSALTTEAALYEIGSGRAGSALKTVLGYALNQDKVGTDRRADIITDRAFNDVLGIPRDDE